MFETRTKLKEELEACEKKLKQYQIDMSFIEEQIGVNGLGWDEMIAEINKIRKVYKSYKDEVRDERERLSAEFQVRVAQNEAELVKSYGFKNEGLSVKYCTRLEEMTKKMLEVTKEVAKRKEAKRPMILDHHSRAY